MIDHASTLIAHSSRVWNYWLGGKDNYRVDRGIGDAVRETTPQIVDMARSSRGFLVRSVTHLTAAYGVRQFLDVGTGLPTANNTHDVAQRACPWARVVYVDNDPIVLAHGRALLSGGRRGQTRYVEADFRVPATVLAAARGSDILDFREPIALVLMNIVGHIGDWNEARRIVSRLVAALPSGSFLIASDGTNVISPESVNAAAAAYNRDSRPAYHFRSPDQLAELFAGLDLLEPGVVSCPRWRPESGSGEPPPVGGPYDVDQFGGVARKR